MPWFQIGVSDVGYKEHVNLTMWFITIRNAYRAEAAGPRKDFLGQMLLEVNARLPVRVEGPTFGGRGL